MDAVKHILRRSRLRSFAASAPARHALHFDTAGLGSALIADDESASDIVSQKREVVELDDRFYASLNEYSPEQLSSMSVASSLSALEAAGAAQTTVQNAAMTTRQAAQAATHGTTINSLTRTVATSVPVYATPVSIATPSTIIPSSILPSSAVTSSLILQPLISTSSSISTSSATSTTTSSTTTSSTTTSSHLTSLSTSAMPAVITVTQTPSSSSGTPVSLATPTNVAAAAANTSDRKTGLSTSGTVGIVLAVILGILFLGSFIAWIYRKYASRWFAAKAPWSRLDDNEATPFPPSYEKSALGTDDVYGGATGPEIGSRRALALARANSFNFDGSYRPNSNYTIDGANNRAGVGAGNLVQYDEYPEAIPGYSIDPQGRPYNPQAGRTPMTHMYQEQYSEKPPTISLPSTSRQLLGPSQHQFSDPALSPVAMGRPAAPTTMTELEQHEDFADILEPDHPGEMRPHGAEKDRKRIPQTATRDVIAGDTRPQQGLNGSNGDQLSKDVMMRDISNRSASKVLQMPLPALQPLSPMFSGFDLHRSSSQPLEMYEVEPNQQKGLYGDAAETASFAETSTPLATVLAPLNRSTSTADTASSFSAHEPSPRLPSMTTITPQPYIHGRPLSPLKEIVTPKPTGSNLPSPSPSAMLGTSPMNPFDRTLVHSRLVPPSSASSSFPSPNYPPPSPGGMSVPGSVGDSPRRWSRGYGAPGIRGANMFDEDDAYGGI